ncbi:hypothetical protein [Phocaeicola vulgatus]|uniref:hypothetical protein n=1 Tax=Phocaeicola vulgatus TaxID=821 RepID=UPI0034A1CFE5
MSWKVYDKTGNTVRCTLKSLEYNGTWMGACFVTSTLKSAVPILFEIGDYVMYRGEKFEINYDPTALKKAARKTSGEAFVYDNVKFNGAGDELTRCDFLDYVKSDNQIHFTSLPKFSFFASSIQDLADRVQVNLDRIYTGVQKWTVVVHPEYVSTTNVNIDVNNIKVWGALELFNSKFGANFIIRGRTITIGTAGIAADNIFRYGRGNGLYEIQRTADADQQIITRLRAYGSTRNMPNRYYNKISNSSLANYLPNNMAVENLMLPDFPKTTLDPYIDSKNIAVLGVREGSVYFDGTGDLEEICPSMEGMTAKQLEDAGIHVSLDAGDNGNLDEVSDAEQLTDDGTMDNLKDGEDIPPFTITLKDIGFDINDETATISMKNGMCGGRDFEITKCEKKGNKYILTCNRIYDEGLKLYFPYKDYNIRGGDKFVLLYIDMPDVYIQAASQRLLAAAKKYLAKNDYVHYSYEPKVDDIFMARQHDEAIARGEVSIHDTLKEGDLMLFTDTDLGIDGSIIIDTLIIKEGEGIIPQYTITLKDEKTVGTLEKIQNQIDSIVSGGQGSGGYNSNQIKSLIKSFGSSFFLSKLITDIANDVITFLKGLKVGKFVTGLIGGSGAAIWFDKNGKTIVEADKAMFREELIVPQITFNCIDVISGDKANSFAYGRIKTVDTENRIATLELLEGQWGTLKVSDICRGILHNIAGSNHTQDEYGPNGFMEYSGYATSYFTPTRIIENEAGNMKFEYALQAGTSVHPLPGMNFFAYGNFTDKDRQAITYENRSYLRRLVNVNTWVIDPDVNIAYQNGNLSGLTVNGQVMDGYSSFQDKVYIRGTIERLKPNGEVAMDLSYEGVWQSGRHYDYYDSVTYNGSTWACLNKNGSSSEPGTDADWQEIASKGDTGAPGKDGVSVTNSGPWYSGLVVPKMSIVTMGGSSFLSKVSTTNPPLWCWTDNAGNRFTYNDGGYCLTGEINTDEYELLVQSGKDGSDGTSYERVFIHTTTESKPATPSTSQTDDYVPSGWHDDPVGVSSSLPYEWISEREKKNGIWSEFSAPALWAKYGFDGADGAEGVAGTSIIWKGDFSSAPSNPQNGWAYKNTTDKKSYVYQDGQWYQMTIDGIDGKNGKDGLSIVWKGDLQTPPSNPQTNWAYRDTNNGRVYIWNGTAWALMVVDGSDGADGAAGSDGLSVFITYNDSTSQPSVPTGNGTTGGWHTNATSSAIWMSQKVAASASDGAWGTPIKIKGDKGDGYTQMGQFRTGMVVPKMGVVSMGGGSYVAKVSTTNPPLWCWTDNAGNRFTFADGGYVLTGEVNTTEYDVWSEKGDTGEKGDKGDKGDDGEKGDKGDKGDQGVQGIQGCIFRESEWSASSVQYRNDEALTSGTRYIDFALIRNDAAIDGWDVYKCLKTHVSSASNKPGNTTYWEKLSGVGPIYTSLIISKNASISLFQGNQVLIKKSDNTVTAGMSGSTSGQKIRIWAGSATPDSAPYRVNEQGEFVSTKANVAGTVTATLLYSPGSDMDSLADSEGNMTVNPSTQGSTFFSADGLGGTITLPPASSWNGLKLEFVVDMTSRVAKNPDKYKATNYFCGLAGAYNNKTEIQMARPYVLEMKAFNNHWYITRMDLIE